MVEEKGFSEERIRNGAKKLLKGREGNTQGRLDSFFKVRLHLLPESYLIGRYSGIVSSIGFCTGDVAYPIRY
jgi:hypothetical protein